MTEPSISIKPTNSFPLWPSVVCGLAFLVLCTLGTWQVARLQWKNDLQAQLDKAYQSDAPLRELTLSDLQNLNQNTMLRGQVRGRFVDLPRAIWQGKILNGRSAVAEVRALELAGSKVLLAVENGCFEPHQLPSAVAKMLPPNAVTVAGVIRQPKKSFMLPDNSPQKNQWWNFDPVELSAYWNGRDVLPVLMIAEDVSSPCPVEKTLRNDHAQYAVFWFTMACVLSALWGIRFLRPYLQSA